jgi:hypothetical protein
MEKIITKLKKACNSSDGDGFEEAMNEALLEISDKSSYVPLGGVTSRFKRLSDGYWILSLIDEEGKRHFLVIVLDTKAGNAINSINLEKEKNNLKNTINIIKKNILSEEHEDFWVWYVGGNNFPSVGGHGGYRLSQNSDSLNTKIFKIQTFLQKIPRVKSVHVTVFSLDCFVEYYRLLYKNMKVKKLVLNKKNYPFFWVWNKLFTKPFVILSDVNFLKKNLK